MARFQPATNITGGFHEIIRWECQKRSGESIRKEFKKRMATSPCFGCGCPFLVLPDRPALSRSSRPGKASESFGPRLKRAGRLGFEFAAWENQSCYLSSVRSYACHPRQLQRSFVSGT